LYRERPSSANNRYQRTPRRDDLSSAEETISDYRKSLSVHLGPGLIIGTDQAKDMDDVGQTNNGI
jgi:hypothetical protein